MHPRTRLIGCVFATIVLFSVGLPAFGQDKTQPVPVRPPKLSKTFDELKKQLNENESELQKLADEEQSALDKANALEQLRVIDSTISTLRSTASQEINARLDQIPQVPRPETPGLKPISTENIQQSPQLVSDADKTKLLNLISDFLHRAQSRRSSFTFWAITFIASSAILACLGGILSFLKKNIWAGSIGLVVTAVIAFSNAYPFNDLAAFYDWLSSQTEALQVECQLKQPFTIDTYDAESKQLKLLILSEANRPRFGNYKAQIQNTTNEVAKVKVAATTIEREQAFAQGTGVVKEAKPETQRILVKNRDLPIHLRDKFTHAMEEKPPQKDHVRTDLLHARKDLAKADKAKSEKPPQN